MNDLKIEQINVSDLVPYENNPRRNDQAVDATAASIREFGFKVPIIIDSDNVIVCGHTRLKAAKKLKLESVPCVRADDLTEEQIKAFRLADNKTAEIADWDLDLLQSELAGIADLDMSLFGFEDLALAEPEMTAEEIDAQDITPPEEPVTKPGDIWQLGRHRLMCGNSTDADAISRLMNGTQAELVFTDPPWNVNYGATDHPSWKKRTIENDNMSTEAFFEFLSQAFSCMADAVVDGGMVYVVMSAQEWGSVMQALTEKGFHWSSTIIWNKDRLVLSRKDYHTKYEPIWYGWKNGAARIRPLKDRQQCDVWDIPRPTRSDEHPTMKPVALVERAIKNSSKQSCIALDQFGGSGTTLLACERTNRTCYMMELEPKYCDVTIRRWEELTGEKAILLEA